MGITTVKSTGGNKLKWYLPAQSQKQMLGVNFTQS